MTLFSFSFKSWLLPLAIFQHAVAIPTKIERGLFDPTVTINFPKATIVGNPVPLIGYKAEVFQGIPFALPPTGDRRLKPPIPITEPMGRILGQKNGNICPQLVFTTNSSTILPIAALAKLAELPVIHEVTTQSEDCLTLNVRWQLPVKPLGNWPGDCKLMSESDPSTTGDQER